MAALRKIVLQVADADFANKKSPQKRATHACSAEQKRLRWRKPTYWNK
jgi:hypothetical protein